MGGCRANNKQTKLDDDNWSTPRPGRITLGKENRYLLFKRQSGPQGRPGQARKIVPTPGFDPQQRSIIH